MDENDKLFVCFLNELRAEISYHSRGGTSYRQRISEFSLEVAIKTGHITSFLDRDQARQVVLRNLPCDDSN